MKGHSAPPATYSIQINLSGRLEVVMPEVSLKVIQVPEIDAIVP